MPPKKGQSPQKKSKEEEEREGMQAFAKELEENSDDEGEKKEDKKEEGEKKNGSEPPSGRQPSKSWWANWWTKRSGVADDAFDTNPPQLSEAEKQIIIEELKKTEDEITTLRQVLNARQKHASDLKRKLGLSPLAELTQDINKGLKGVTDSDAYKATSEAAAATAETVKTKFNDMRNSSLFKSFESKLGSALTTTKMAASTSIDKLSAAARGTNGNPSNASTPSTEHNPIN